MENSSGVAVQQVFSAACLRRGVDDRFSDRAHIEFYGYIPKPVRIRSSFKASCCSSRNGWVSFCASRPHTFSGVRCLEEATSASQQEELLKELADMKMEMKRKKRQLKNIKKAMKSEIKMKRKEEKVNATSKTRDESSSSESSDSECEDMGMRLVRSRPYLSDVMDKGICDATPSCRLERNHEVPDHSGHLSVVDGEYRFVTDVAKFAQPMPELPLQKGRVQVCLGGKCKRAGSERVLSDLRSQTKGTLVETVPCKCMGKCGMPVNVRVLKSGVEQWHYHSNVGADDVDLILKHNFGAHKQRLPLNILEPYLDVPAPAAASKPNFPHIVPV